MPLDVNDWNLNLTDIILGVFQEYKDHAPWCDREKNQGRNLVEDSTLWTTSIPHAEKSGKCFTYKYKSYNIQSMPVQLILYFCLAQRNPPRQVTAIL